MISSRFFEAILEHAFMGLLEFIHQSTVLITHDIEGVAVRVGVGVGNIPKIVGIRCIVVDVVVAVVIIIIVVVVIVICTGCVIMIIMVLTFCLVL